MQVVGKRNIFSPEEISGLIASVQLAAAFGIAAGDDPEEIYTELAQHVMRFAHQGRPLKTGGAFVTHPQYVGDQQKDPLDRQIGYLHDVCEDSNLSPAHLYEMGFCYEVCENVHVLTNPKKRLYLDSIESVAPYPRASRVRLTDLDHNSWPSRAVQEEKFEIDIAKEECRRIGIPYFKYLEQLRSQGHEDRAATLSIGQFLYESDFLSTQTEIEIADIRRSLQRHSSNPGWDYWLRRGIQKRNSQISQKLEPAA